MFGGVGIGIDATEEAFVAGFSPESPIQIEALRVGIELKDGVVGDGTINDFLCVDLAGFSPQQQSAGYVANHVDMWVFDGGDEALGQGIFILGEASMYGGNDVIQLLQQTVIKIQFPFIENIDPAIT